MQTITERLEFAPPATPGLLRALLLALLAHGLLLAALTWGVQWKRDAQQLSVDAELWAAVPQEAAPPLPPPEPVKPAPQAAVEPPMVDIAMEREQQRQQQKKLAQERQLEKLRLEKIQQEQRRQAQLQANQLKQTQEKKKAEQDAKRLEALRQQNLQRMTGMAGASGAATASGNAQKAAGPSASYAGRIRARIKPNIVFTDEIRGNPAAEVEVRTAPDGTIVNRTVTHSSGVPEWDQAVLRAIDKTQVLPRDVDGSMPPALLLVFRPKD